MNVEKLIHPANCSRAELRISTSLRTKYRFYERYWLFYCSRIHWFFSLIVFSTDAGRGRAASNWYARVDIFHKERIQKQIPGRIEQPRTSCREQWHKPVERLFLPSAQLLGGGHLFLTQKCFDLFASASASSIYKGHEREWVIHLSVCMWVCMCVCVRLDLFLLHWHEVGISASLL